MSFARALFYFVHDIFVAWPSKTGCVKTFKMSRISGLMKTWITGLVRTTGWMGMAGWPVLAGWMGRTVVTG